MPISIIKKILVPYDLSTESVKGLQFALYLSEKIKASITLIHVIPYKSMKYEGKGIEQLPAKYIGKIVKNSARAFKSQSKALESRHNIKVDSIVKVGKIERTICETAQTEGYDLIIMGTKGTIRSKLLPCITERVASSSSVPVFKVHDVSNQEASEKEKWIQTGLNLMRINENEDSVFLENSLVEKGVPENILKNIMQEIKK